MPVQVPVEILKEVVREVPVEREVVREVPVEVVREVPVDREVVREVPVEVVKEIVRDVPVEIVREVPVDREVVREVVRDTTRIDEEELRRLRRRLEELETVQDQLASRAGRMPVDEKMQALLNMAGGVGHVFNNVLAGILGRTQLLVKRASREKSKEIASGLHEIEAATRTGIDALTRIQEFSRSRPAEPFASVDLNDVVQRAVEQTRARWRDEPSARGAPIELITHFGPHSQLIGAESELLEAVVQLLHNAVDAMPRGGTITIRTGLDTGRGTVSVSDTGVGMSEAVRRRAFEPFFSTKGETGLGLGLSMVYGVMARHGGDATVDSEEGRGTTVTLHLPTSGEGAPAPLSVPETDRPQVLLVDDDETRAHRRRGHAARRRLRGHARGLGPRGHRQGERARRPVRPRHHRPRHAGRARLGSRGGGEAGRRDHARRDPLRLRSGPRDAPRARARRRSRDLQAIRYPGVPDHRSRALGRPQARLAALTQRHH